MRQMRNTIGSGDQAHSTNTMAMFWSSLALATIDSKVYRDHLEAFRWKMTLMRNWEGGFIPSECSNEFMGAEGVLGLWIQTSTYMMMLNGEKHNLAITGRKDLLPEKLEEGVTVHNWDYVIYRYYLRNWAVAEAMLGSKCPAELKRGVKKLQQFPLSTNFT